MCGENINGENIDIPGIGSPPRVRGKQSSLFSIYIVTGITPACAGKTFLYDGGWRADEDHPRVCGENTLYLQILETG